MAVKACKKCDPHEICEECPEWIFTLADLIMCMMGLFVLLWVLKPSPSPNAAKTPPPDDTVKVLAAIREAFGYDPDPKSNDPIDKFIILDRLRRQGNDGDQNKGRAKEEPTSPAGTEDANTTVRVGPQTTVGGRLLFERGSAEFTPNTLARLDSIAVAVRGIRIVTLVKGHASRDDFGEAATEAKNLELSVRRARAVADYLVSQGVSADILRVQGCSVFEPVSERAYTAAAQAENRRVEVQTTTTLVEELRDNHLPDSAYAAPADEAKTTGHGEHGH